MIRGMNKFQEHFAGFGDQYVLIGGAASDLVMEDAGATFRATKDLDIVLCLEALNQEFAEAFWEFINAGGYQNQGDAEGVVGKAGAGLIGEKIVFQPQCVVGGIYGEVFNQQGAAIDICDR